jgi:hypothetical protein
VYFTGKRETPSSNLPASIIPGAIHQHDAPGQHGALEHAFQRRVDLQQQGPQSVDRSGDVMGQVLVGASQHFEIGQHIRFPIHRPQGVWHRARRIGDDERIPGIRLRLPRIQIGSLTHRQPGQVGDIGSTIPGDRDG